MLTPQLTIPLALILFVAALFAAMSDQSINPSGDTALSSATSEDINAVLDFSVFNIREVSITGLNFTLPMINVAFFRGLFDVLTWNYSYFSGTWNMLRLPLIAITFTVGLAMLISVGPVIVSVASFFAQVAMAAIGGVAGLTRIFRGF